MPLIDTYSSITNIGMGFFINIILDLSLFYRGLAYISKVSSMVFQVVDTLGIFFLVEAV